MRESVLILFLGTCLASVAGQRFYQNMKCRYCDSTFDNINDTVCHCVENHPAEKVSYTWKSSDGRSNHQRTYNVLGSNVTGKQISFDPQSGKMIVPTKSSVSDSPVRKLHKINTPSKSVHSQLYSQLEVDQEHVEDLSSSSTEATHSVTDLSELLDTTALYSDSESDNGEYERMENTNDIPDAVMADTQTVKMVVHQLKTLLPSVTAHLADCGRLHEWINFFHLIDSGDFSVKHIAAQLFLDVIKFSSLEDVRLMRYSPEVRQFWTVGQALFKSKFMRLMGGYKVFSGASEHGDSDNKSMTKTDINMINFVCPNKDVLKEERKKYAMDCSTPGIIHSNIQAVTSSLKVEEKSFNLCIDGKKIAPGFGTKLGDVDLFGHESEPTYSSKKNRFEMEMHVIEETIEEISKWIERDVTIIDDVSREGRELVYTKILDILSVNTERLKEMRTLKVSRNVSLEKLLKMATEPWQKSKYSFAISSVKTQMHDIDRCINDMLELNTKLGLVAAGCYGTESAYSVDSVIDMKYQENHICLNPVNVNNITNSEVPTEFIKQRTQQWQNDRKLAKVTGSTLFQALGLSTLKKQQEHYDRVISDKSKSSDVTNEAMIHGIENEVNAVGTLVGRILPIFCPYVMFHEEGYYKLPSDTDTTFMVVSPDGSCRKDNQVEYAIEIKCPMPGKKYTTDVHYEVPKYYVTQLLAEMAALKCDKLLYVSWTPESTTVMKVKFEENLWDRMQKELVRVYGRSEGTSRPSKKSPEVAKLLKDIELFRRNNVSLLCEISSIVSIGCNHLPYSDEDTLTFTHNRRETDRIRVQKETESKKTHLTPSAILALLSKEMSALDAAYDILRIPAKEVLVAVLSDLDRQYGPTNVHGVPIAYGLSGYSLKVECMRSFMEHLILECYKTGIAIRSLSTDGQFYRLCVRDKKDRPLTILQLAKGTWEKVKKISKAEQVSELMGLNAGNHENLEDIRNAIDSQEQLCEARTGAVLVNGWKNRPWPKLYNPRKLNELVNRKTKPTEDSVAIDTSDLMNLPAEAANTLIDEVSEAETYSFEDRTRDTQCSAAVLDVWTQNTFQQGDVANSHCVTDGNTEVMEEDTDLDGSTESNVRIDVDTISEDVLGQIVSDLTQIDEKRKRPKWKSLDVGKLKDMLKADPSILLKKLSKDEMVICAKHFENTVERATRKQTEHLTKLELVNAFSAMFGQHTFLTKKKSPPTLKRILKDLFSKRFNKEALNAITATRRFLDCDLPNWRDQAIFKDGIFLGDTDTPHVWYTQPEHFQDVDQYIVYLLDCHHLFVNARSFVCQYGIKGLDIKKEAWSDVADCAGTGLNKAMVEDLIDRQSNAIAQIVFGEQVEDKMIELGWKNEAYFCKCIRQWYRAEDEAGLDTRTRYDFRMTMRDLLLRNVHLADFPPPGSHVAGMPIVMFEGILTNIDRRYQLHALVPGNRYNVRAPNTLAVENLFGGFQDLDPKSTGVLLADDIPHAIGTASYLIQSRLDPDRSFEMRTTKSSKVYPEEELHMVDCEISQEVTTGGATTITTLSRIPVRAHTFDLVQRKRTKPKRKRGNVPDYRMPSRGTQPVRQHHKADSSKILPHVRHGLVFDT